MYFYKKLLLIISWWERRFLRAIYLFENYGKISTRMVTAKVYQHVNRDWGSNDIEPAVVLGC